MVDLPADTAPPEADCIPDLPHPRHAERVIGHAGAEAELLAAFNTGRMHHAWLLSGPQGIGKATLAWRVARFLLATPIDKGDALFAAPPPESLDISPDHPVARRVAALSEPRLFLLRRPWDAKKEKLATQITVEETRKLKWFFQMSAADGERRVVIVDTADEMNVSAANALLKALEEPPAETVILLVSHQPSRLLPTIRSRCRTLRLSPLNAADHAEACAMAGIEPDPSLHELSQGSVGDAARLQLAGGPALYASLIELLQGMPGLDRNAAVKLADAAGARGDEDRFGLTLTLIERLLGRLARTGATGTPPAEIVPGEAEMLHRLAPSPAHARGWADLAQSLTAKARRGKAVNLDPSALILDIFLQLDRAA